MRNMSLKYEAALACKELLKAGVIMHRTPDEILRNFLNEWEKISGEYAAKNPFYKKVIDSQKKYAETIVPYRLSWYPNLRFRRQLLLEGSGLLQTVGVSETQAVQGGRRSNPAPVAFIISAFPQ